MDPPAGEQDTLCASDSDLATRFKAGDWSAFRTVYEEYVAGVYAIALRLSGDSTRAEDLTQEAFLRAWDRRRTLRDCGALGAWLGRIAVNVSLTGRRADMRRLRRELREPPAWDPPDDSVVGDTTGALDLECAIARLPPGARAVFVLHDVEGHTHEEIGALLGIAAGTSKAHLHRAHRLLREELER